MRGKTGALCVILLFTGCATSPGSIKATYVSDERYATLECDEMARLRRATVDEIGVMTADQERKAFHDQLAVATALIAPISLIGIGAQGPDQGAELARLMGERDALHRAGQRQQCWTLAEAIAEDIPPAPPPPPVQSGRP